jgi:hypothetical protein
VRTTYKCDRERLARSTRCGTVAAFVAVAIVASGDACIPQDDITRAPAGGDNVGRTRMRACDSDHAAAILRRRRAHHRLALASFDVPRARLESAKGENGAIRVCCDEFKVAVEDIRGARDKHSEFVHCMDK